MGSVRRARALIAVLALVMLQAVGWLAPAPARAVTLIANDDAATVVHDHTLVKSAPGVLGNDVGLLGGTVMRVDGTDHGSLDLNNDGSYTYVPDAGFAGTDTFSYKVRSLLLVTSNTAQVTISVTNATPVAKADTYTWSGGTLVVPAPGVLANDTDADGDALIAEIDGGGLSGSFDAEEDGSFRYSPGGGFSGTGTVTYRVTDGIAWSATKTVTLTINAPTPTPTSIPVPTPRPTARPTPRPTPTPTPVALPTLPLPSLPVSSPPLPVASLPAPPLPGLSPGGSPSPAAGSSASAASSERPAPGQDRPSPSDGLAGPGAGGAASPPGGALGTGGGSGNGGVAIGGGSGTGLLIEYGNGRELDLNAGLGNLMGTLDVWAVPAATISGLGLLVLLFVALQAGGALVWLPAVWRLRGDSAARPRFVRR